MQFKIPQNVQIEDKIVGPLTFKQLITLGIGGGLAYVLYLSLGKRYFIEIWLPPVAVVSIATLAFAFVKPLGVTFMHYILLLIEFWFKPRKRAWVKGSGDVYFSVFTNASSKPTKVEKKAHKKHSEDVIRLSNLDELSYIVDTHGEAASNGMKK